MDSNAKEFILAYAALCKKHGLCIAPESPYDGGLFVAEYDEDWAEDIALSAGVEMFEVIKAKLEV